MAAGKRETTSVYSLRLDQDTITELELRARLRNIRVSALVRLFIAEGLAIRRGGVEGAIARLKRDRAELRRIAAWMSPRDSPSAVAVRR